MITRRSDYLYVTGDLDQIVIDGEIMPLRTGVTGKLDKSGYPIPRANILRGEDIAFLLESLAERRVAAYGSPPSPNPFERRVSQSQILSCAAGVSPISALNSSYGLYDRKSGFTSTFDATPPVGQFEIKTWVDAAIDTLGRSAVEHVPYETVSGINALSRSAVEKMFVNQERSRIFFRNGDVTLSGRGREIRVEITGVNRRGAVTRRTKIVTAKEGWFPWGYRFGAGVTVHPGVATGDFYFENCEMTRLRDVYQGSPEDVSFTCGRLPAGSDVMPVYLIEIQNQSCDADFAWLTEGRELDDAITSTTGLRSEFIGYRYKSWLDEGGIAPSVSQVSSISMPMSSIFHPYDSMWQGQPFLHPANITSPKEEHWAREGTRFWFRFDETAVFLKPVGFLIELNRTRW